MLKVWGVVGSLLRTFCIRPPKSFKLTYGKSMKSALDIRILNHIIMIPPLGKYILNFQNLENNYDV